MSLTFYSIEGCDADVNKCEREDAHKVVDEIQYVPSNLPHATAAAHAETAADGLKRKLHRIDVWLDRRIKQTKPTLNHQVGYMTRFMNMSTPSRTASVSIVSALSTLNSWSDAFPKAS